MNEKTKSILAYLFSIIGGFVVLLMKDSEQNTRIHAAQAIVIGGGYFLMQIAYAIIPFSIPFFGMIIQGLYFICIILGIVKAYNEQDPELPVIGPIAKSIFAKQIEG